MLSELVRAVEPGQQYTVLEDCGFGLLVFYHTTCIEKPTLNRIDGCASSVSFKGLYVKPKSIFGRRKEKLIKHMFMERIQVAIFAGEIQHSVPSQDILNFDSTRFFEVTESMGKPVFRHLVEFDDE